MHSGSMPHETVDASDDMLHFALSDEDFTFIIALVYQCSGIILQENKKPMVHSRLSRRLRVLNMDGFGAYCRFLQSPKGAEEIVHFVNALTTNLTHFFREEHHFEHIAEQVFTPALRAKKRLRIWSAGCSMGAEPYTLAMILHELAKGGGGLDMKILATDIDSAMIEKGMSASYPNFMGEPIPDQYRRYITEGEKEFVIAESIKRYITFRQLNLLHHPWPMKGLMDAIFCRNVVIYFDKETQKTLFDRFADMLPMGGFLYIGHSESLHKVTDRFELVGRTIYQRIK